MRWQFGGNFQPVRMICEIDWRECPAAVINYVWSEIVTDVVECFTNEWMMWRVIAMLFVCTLLIHTIYSKAKLMDETTTNRDNLSVVGCKVQDLELKVNILTYKMQYGTWPLPRQIRGSGVERELRNVRLTLTNSNDRNAWLKHMLLSPRENAPCVPYAKIGPRSVRCLTKLINLETKYMSSRFAREASPLSQKENRSSSSEISTKCTRRDSRRSLVEAVAAKKDAKSENLEVRREESTTRACAKRPTSWSETGVSKCRESARTPPLARTTRESRNEKRASRRSSRRDETPEERVNATSETLHEVRKKLEELHSVLRIYGSASGGNEQSGATNKRLAETILRDLKNLGDDLPESESDAKPREPFAPENENASDLPCKNHESESSEFEQCRSDFSSSSEIAKSRTTDEPEVPTIPEAEKSISSIPAEMAANDRSTERPEKSTSDEKCSLVEEAPSAISSAAETSRDSDTDERTNAILLREALQFRSALVSRLELESSDRVGLEIANSSSRAKLPFQPKYLDIISEEHSAGSSTEKSTRARELLGMKENRKCREVASSGLALASSSEYFSLSSVDLKDMMPREETHLQDDLSDLVNRSVRNIRDYVEAFSRLQNDAIAETRRAINDEDTLVSLGDPTPRDSLDSITRFVNTLAITISEELPREMSEPAITSHALVVNSDDDSHGTSGCTRDFVLERRPGTISLTDKNFSLDEAASRLHDTIPESLDSDEPSLSSEPSCKQLSRDYSEDTTSESNETRRPDTSLAIHEDDNSARQDASRIDSPLTGRTVVRATGSSIDNLGLSTCESLESFEVTKNTCRDDTKDVNAHECEIRESNVVQETSSLYFTDQASFPDIEAKFFDYAVDRLTGIESNASIFDDSDRSYEITEVDAPPGDFNDRPEVAMILENAEPEVPLDSEDFNSEPEVPFEHENCQPEVEAERITGQEVFERPEVRVETLVEQTEVAESDVSDEKPEVRSNRNNVPENSDLKPQINNRKLTPEVRREYESVSNEKPEVCAENRSTAPEARRERVPIEKPEVKPKRESLNASTNRRENSSENSSSGGLPDANSDPSESELRDIASTLSEEPSGIYVDASSREFFNLIGTNLRLDKRFSLAPSSKSARGSCSSPLQLQKRSITRMLPRRGSSLDIVERSTTRPECSSKNREKTADSGKFVKTCGQTTKWTDIAIGERGGSGLELPKRRSRSNATPRKSENSPRCRDIPESSETRRRVGKRKNLEAEKSHEKVEKSCTPVRCASSGRSARSSRVAGEMEEVEMETSRSETGSGPSGAGSRPSRTGSRPSATGSRTSATGRRASATGSGALTTGSGALTTGSGALATGSGASATGNGALATGSGAFPTGSGALATGSEALATGSGSFATGSGSLRTGSGSLRTGSGAFATGSEGFPTGNGAFATGSGSLPTGSGAYATGSESFPTGNSALAAGSASFATGSASFVTGSGAFGTESSSAVASSNTSNNRVAKQTRSDDADGDIVSKSERSALGRNSSRSCIPVLKSRLEAVRGNEKRAKSPARCPLTMSTSSWNQENRSAPVSAIRVDPKIEGSRADETIESKSNENGAGNDPEKWPDRRTVIYVNIVTEREQKSATRIVDPKKFLEYLKDRELKIQSVQDDVAKNNRCEIGAESPRILTVVSSAVDERTNDGGAAARGSWSLRVERREIEVSAKPSVIDTSTSISDLPETQSLVLDNPKFQIFEVPKELTKDEYIVLLETLNRDPNLEQLREMHNLCDKLGVGFNE